MQISSILSPASGLTTMDNMEFFSALGIPNVWSPCPLHIHRKLIQAGDHIDDETVEGIEEKLGPTLEKLVELGPGHYHSHPSISKIFKWLVDPQRTSHEFNYFVGPMGKYKFDHSGRFKNLYLGLVAAEALALRNPVLVGPWEEAAWFVVWLNNEYSKEYNYGYASDILSEWIIRIIGDPVLCPNNTLRLGFMNMFSRMVCISHENGRRAFDAVMSACYSLPMDDHDFFTFFLSEMKLCSITSMLEKCVAGGYMLAFDQSIVDIFESRVSGIICDVSCSYGLNPNKCTRTREAAMVTWLFQITLVFAHLEFDKFSAMQFYPEQENDIEDVTHSLLLLVTNFKKSCQSPRIIDFTANCVMYVLELVLQVNVALMHESGNLYPMTLHTTHKVLLELCDETNGYNVVLSPVGQVLQHKYQDRLCNLRQKLGKYLPDSSVICNLLYHCNLIE